METIGSMTKEELVRLIDETVDRRLKLLLGEFEFEFLVDEPADGRSLEEVLASIDRHRWTPPPGTPSVNELLREDRDR